MSIKLRILFRVIEMETLESLKEIIIRRNQILLQILGLPILFHNLMK